MAEAALNDLYQCALCLDELKDPVTIPCGHSYCQRCISSCWNQRAQTGVYSCPQCRETFSPRPALKKNTVLTALIDQLRIAETQDSSSGLCFAGPGDVECDACTERKLKAVKSCLMCLASFCETHVQPHYKSPAFKKHDLMDASAHLQEKICCQHGRLLEMFCRTDQTCVCMLCTINEHRGHDTVSITAESNEKKITLQEVKKTSLQQIQEREKNLRELRNALVSYELSADAAVQHSEMIFGELLKFIKTKGTEVNEMIRNQQGAAVSRAEPVIKRLEEEIAELRQEQDALEQLSHEEDHFQFLQSFKAVLPTLKATHLPSMAGSPSLSFNNPSGFLSVLKQEVEKLCIRMQEITTRFKEPLHGISEFKRSETRLLEQVPNKNLHAESIWKGPKGIEMNIKDPLMTNGLRINHIHWELMKKAFKKQIKDLKNKFDVDFQETTVHGNVTVHARSVRNRTVYLEVNALRALMSLYQKVVTTVMSCPLQNASHTQTQFVKSYLHDISKQHPSLAVMDEISTDGVLMLIGLPDHLCFAISQIEEHLGGSAFDQKLKEMIEYELNAKFLRPFSGGPELGIPKGYEQEERRKGASFGGALYENVGEQGGADRDNGRGAEERSK